MIMLKKRPFLKWAGNKYRCLDKILNMLSPAKRLIEPFTGSGAIFINSDYSQYLLGEQNPDLISLYNFLKQYGNEFIEFCSTYFLKEYNCRVKYNEVRDEFNQIPHQYLRAALFLYLNRHGYNGLCRYNQKGLYNVPFGRYEKPYFPKKEMQFFHEKSQHADFTLGDFRETFAQAEKGDIIYCDPPYVPLSLSANFSAYTNKKFNEKDQLDLAYLAIETASRGIPVIISNHDTSFTRHHYRSGEIISFPVMRSISCIGGQRLPVQELIALFK